MISKDSAGRTPVIDSHCHAWPRWPYQPAVPDDSSRGSMEMLSSAELGTAALSMLGYEHNLSQPVIRLWNDTQHVR